MATITTLQNATTIISYLQNHHINPILYGSLGASLYLGDFKIFSDVDLLIESEWLYERWPELQQIMSEAGFTLVDEHEHEFKNADGTMVALAEETVLIRDDIIDSLDNLTTGTIDSLTFRTLTPQQFKQAYLFSVKDGYRLESRGKKDQVVIDLLEAYVRDSGRAAQAR